MTGMPCELWWALRRAEPNPDFPTLPSYAYFSQRGSFTRHPLRETVAGVEMWRGNANKLRHLVNTGPR